MPPHLADGEILALLDGEHGTLAESARRHLDECGACRERRDRFSEYDAFAREELSSISVPLVDEDSFRRRLASRAVARRDRWSTPSHRWRRPRWVAAAAIVALTAAAAAASPVRRWLRSFVDAPIATQSVSRPAPWSSPQSSSGGSVSFIPTNAIFTVRLDSVPASGVLRIETTSDERISASVVSGAATGGDAFVVLPAELRIRNTSQARASYRITLPRSITRFRAVVAGSVVYEGAAPASVTLSRR